MKKIITLAIFSFVILSFIVVKAQTVVFSSDFESWTGNVPNNWVGAKTNLSADSISPYTVSAHSPVTAVKLQNGGTTHKRFSTKSVSVTTGTVYYVSFWVRGHGNIRIGMFDNRTSGSGYAVYHPYLNINSTSWVQYTDTIVCKNTTSSGEFIWSVQSTEGDKDHLQLDDVSVTDGPMSTNPMISITSPVDNSTFYSNSVTVNFNVLNFIVGNPGGGIDGHVHYSVDGGAAVMQYTTAPIALTGLTAGTHTVITQLVDNSHAPLSPNVADTVHFIINLTPPNPLTIHDIQYTTDPSGNSPWKDSLVSTTGIVTGVGAPGYFIQDGAGAWNGIYVFDNTHQPALGDNISVTATVDEFYNYTELKNVLGYAVISSGNPLPAATTVTAANIKPASGEQYEGVLAKIVNATNLISAPVFGEWKLNDGTDSLKSHQLLFTYTLLLNKVYSLTGPIYYSYGEYKIEPRDINDVSVGINEWNNDVSAINIYPNPVKDVMFVSNNDGAKAVRITNILGEELLNSNVFGATTKIDVNTLSPGIYFISLINKDGIAGTRKFIKE